MSSLASAPRPAESDPAKPTAWARARLLLTTGDATLGLGLAGGLALAAFLTTGGVDLGPNTWVQVALTVLGAALAAAVVVLGAPGRPWGLATLVLFAALAALTFASIAWSAQPANSWLEANRTFSYLAAFGAAMAIARLAPTRWPALVGAVGTFAVVVCGYALLVKVFPATFDSGDQLGRLRAPFDYWNATGLVAALGLAPCLWAAARRGGGRALQVLSVPAIAVLVVVLVLSYSRGALLAAAAGLACWFALVPLRLRGALMLALGVTGGAVATTWALANHAITHDHIPLQSRTAAGHTFGVVLLSVLAGTTIVGLAAALAMDRWVLSARLRRRVGMGLVVLVALVPFGGVGALAASSRGLTGEVSHLWNTLTNPNSVVLDNPGRLAELGSSRPRYWSEGLKVGEHALLAGAGALGYATARTRYTTSPWPAQHAHSYAIETFADFGLIGVALSLALVAAWGLAARRALRAGPAASQQHAVERAGLATMLAVAVTFGVHSLIDWTWFIPGAALPALMCAGWLAARGPLAAPVGRAQRRRHLSRSPGAGAMLVALAAVTILAAWVIWQPLRSADANASAITAMYSRGDARGALADARTAAASDPVSVDPLWELSEIYTALGDSGAAHRELVTATSLQPSNPQTWEQLGDYDLAHGRAREAVGALGTALHLDLSSVQIQQALTSARAELSHR